jgi:1-acyl-sn-glycerol-3-phosphate acyltransferase
MSSYALGRVVRPTLGRLILLLLRARFHGVENVPEGGVMLAGNHVSYMDPVVLWC